MALNTGRKLTGFWRVAPGDPRPRMAVGMWATPASSYGGNRLVRSAVAAALFRIPRARFGSEIDELAILGKGYIAGPAAEEQRDRGPGPGLGVSSLLHEYGKCDATGQTRQKSAPHPGPGSGHSGPSLKEVPFANTRGDHLPTAPGARPARPRSIGIAEKPSSVLEDLVTISAVLDDAIS